MFGLFRSQYFEKTNELSYIEQMIKFGNKVQDAKSSNQVDMFGDTAEASLQAPIALNSNPWTTMEMLSKEKEVVGIYISGHPLDDYKFEIDNFCSSEISALRNLDVLLGKEIAFAAVVTMSEHKTTKKGNARTKQKQIAKQVYWVLWSSLVLWVLWSLGSSGSLCCLVWSSGLRLVVFVVFFIRPRVYGFS